MIFIRIFLVNLIRLIRLYILYVEIIKTHLLEISLVLAMIFITVFACLAYHLLWFVHVWAYVLFFIQVGTQHLVLLVFACL